MRIKTLYVVLISVVLSWAAAAYAAEYSADMVTTTPQLSTNARLYVSGQKTRVEMAGAIIIGRIDKQVTWMLMPQQKMYMEHPMDERTMMSTQDKVDGEIERVAEGLEIVNGVRTTKYRFTSEKNGRRMTAYQWIDDANHIPVKIADADGRWCVEMKNINRAPQDQSLFEIPEGYSKMSINMPNMSGMTKK